MSDGLVAAGIVLLFIAVALIVVGGVLGSKSETRVAVGGWLGPIPFGFASDPRLLALVLGLSAALLIFIVAVKVLA